MGYLNAIFARAQEFERTNLHKFRQGMLPKASNWSTNKFKVFNHRHSKLNYREKGEIILRHACIYSWKRLALCYAVLDYARNRWEFKSFLRGSMENNIWSIYNVKDFDIWTLYTQN